MDDLTLLSGLAQFGYGCFVAGLGLLATVMVTAVITTIFDVFLDLEQKIHQAGALSASWRLRLQKSVLLLTFSFVWLLTLPTVLEAFGLELEHLFVWQFYQMVLTSGTVAAIVLFVWLAHRLG